MGRLIMKNMNKSIKILSILTAMLTLAACGDDEMDVKFTDIGPQMEIVSCDSSAFMGDSVRFSVNLSDDFPLSTLKAYLYYDETNVSSVTIRTKTEGTYTAAIAAPIYADISDGTATLTFTAQNTGLGTTTQTVDVDVSRPNPDYMTLDISGSEYTMEKVSDYEYEVTDYFPADAAGTVTTAPLDDDGHTVTFYWSGSALDPGSTDDIPFAMASAGTYKISVNLLTLTASPFGTISSSISSSSTTEVLNLIQGAEIEFPNVSDILDWNLDYDFFTVNSDNTITFKPVSGLYKFTADFDEEFIKVEAMSDEDEYSTFDADSLDGAIWVIGSGFGKPTIGPSWNTEDGAYCLSEIEDKVYQVTLTAGESITKTGYSIKFFYQKGWGGEFTSYSTVEDGGLIKVTDSGNIEPADGVSLEIGQAYTFKVDLTGGLEASVLSIEEADIPVATLDISLNGVAATRVSSTHYLVDNVALEQDGYLLIDGLSMTDLMSWYLDPDYMSFDGTGIKFGAVSGTFDVDLYLDDGYATFRRQDSSGEDATISDGALWLMGWGIGNPFMTSQLGFTPGSAFCMAEVEPMVFQLTGTAVSETSTEKGGRFRYDYISGKYFGQNGWGLECGKIIDSDVSTTVNLEGSAASLLKLTDSYNFELADGVQLEEGATYVLTIDLTQAESDNIETIKFEKQ
jgi:hypothetical protein